ncbi:MAG: aldo/keto reductase [Bacteroidales bacterium]
MKNNKVNRRRFLRNSSLGFLGAGLLGEKSFSSPVLEQDNKKPVISKYSTLGRTGFKVSNLGFGRPANPAILKAGINAGINYFDTAPNYGSSERDIGSIIHEFDRKKLFITTKIHADELGSKEHILSSARKSLENLKTDYIDCFQLQGATSCEMVRHKGFHDAFAQLKHEGRVKFCGIACHGSYFPGNIEDTMENILLCAIDDGRFDLLLVVYNFLSYEQGEKVLKAAKEKNIATTVMKSNPVKMYNMFKGFEEQAEANNQEFPEHWKNTYEEFKQHNKDAQIYLETNGIISNDDDLSDVATRFVLDNPDVNTVLVDFQNFGILESHLKYASESLTPASINHLTDLRNIITKVSCRIGCNACESSCPHNVPVNTILRYNYYFTAKGEEKFAMHKYQDLPGGKPDACLACEGFCERACPHGVLTRPLLAMAHKNLSLDGPQISLGFKG